MNTAVLNWLAVWAYPRTWYNYETGVRVPYDVLARFIEQTGANPIYLICGEGEHYRHPHDERRVSDLTAIELIRRGLEKLEGSSPEPEVEKPG